MVVLDTSVIIKWFVKEKGSERALFWMEKHIEGTEIILVPSLFFYEITNVLRYNKDLPTNKILEVIENLFRLNLKVEEINFEMMMKSVVLAREKEISLYDACIEISIASKSEKEPFMASRFCERYLVFFALWHLSCKERGPLCPVFIVLAKIYQTSFYTADSQLYQKMKGLDFVKLL
jgi:predicted nucleic acid-binding protein